ncbi:MAG: DNA (cytosine-5-)-methyltransferase [Symploca sp. SIO2E6]|nr:DNA (cytosine-5-)-methyltransferase [Symploca sp. SIO2E6]
MFTIRFIDLFAGIGGIRLAFEQAMQVLGIPSKCVFTSEIDTKACETYLLNFPEQPYGDIAQYSNEIPEFDFLLAGFPCQPFSYAGKREGFGDTRGTLFFEVEKILKKYRPRGLFLENVRGLVSHDRGRTLQTILHSLDQLGYSTSYVLCNSSNFGIPQNRVRIYILGILDHKIQLTISTALGSVDSHAFKKDQNQLNLFSTTYPHSVVRDILEVDVDHRYHCSKDFISRLDRLVNRDFEQLHGKRLIDTRGGNSIHSWDLGIKGECSELERQFMNALMTNRRKNIFGTHQDGKMLTKQQIKTFFDVPGLEKLIQSLMQKGCLKCVDGKYNPVCGNMSFEVFKFLDPDSISITLTSSDTHKLGVVQQGIPRRITPREAARLQGFPDNFVLHPNDNATYKQMGNAVSVSPVKAVLQDMFEQNNLV